MAAAGEPPTAVRLLGARAGSPLGSSRDAARRAAHHELSKPLYHQHDPSLLQRAADRFWSWVGDLFHAASGAAPGGPLGVVVVALVVLALVGALWWRLGSPVRSASTTADGTLFGQRSMSADAHRRAAEEHAAARRWNAAVQERMRAVVRSLEERAVLEAGPGRTATEAANEAGRALPECSDRLRAAARDFDDVTYGGRTADHDAYQRMLRLDDDLRPAKPRAPTGSGPA